MKGSRNIFVWLSPWTALTLQVAPRSGFLFVGSLFPKYVFLYAVQGSGFLATPPFIPRPPLGVIGLACRWATFLAFLFGVCFRFGF